MKSLTNVLPRLPQISPDVATRNQDPSAQNRICGLIVLTLLFVALVLMMSSMKRPFTEDSGYALAAGEGPTSPKDGLISHPTTPVYGSSDLPFRIRDGITLYLPAREPLSDSEGMSSANDGLSMRFEGGHDGSNFGPHYADKGGAEVQYPNSNRNGGDAGFLSSPRESFWVGAALGTQNQTGVDARRTEENNGSGAFFDRSTGSSWLDPPESNHLADPTDVSSDDRNDRKSGDLPRFTQGDPAQSVPEPGSLMILGSALLSFCLVIRQKTCSRRREVPAGIAAYQRRIPPCRQALVRMLITSMGPSCFLRAAALRRNQHTPAMFHRYADQQSQASVARRRRQSAK
jgi:hypothetical protein